MRVVVCLILCLTCPAPAEVRVSFPLQGYYRPGRMMPVRISWDPALDAGEVVLLADGAVPTHVNLTRGQAEATVPWLPVTELRNARLRVGAVERPIAQELRIPAADERLVLNLRGGVGAARPLFPDQRLILVSDDPAQPSDSDWAWESFDAVVLDASQFKAFVLNDISEFGTYASANRVRPQAMLSAGLKHLTGAGVSIIALQSGDEPDTQWPWQKVGDAWVLQHTAIGPQELIEPDVYLVGQGWGSGWPGEFRMQLYLRMLVLSIIVAAVALWRPRRRSTVLTITAAVGVFVVAMSAWYQRHPDLRQGTGMIQVYGRHMLQSDTWTFATPIVAADYSCGMAARPVLASLAQAKDLDLRLVAVPLIGTDGSFVCRLGSGDVIAFRERSMQPMSKYDEVDREQPPTSWLVPLARRVYREPGLSIVGEWGDLRSSNGFNETWASVVMRRTQAPATTQP